MLELSHIWPRCDQCKLCGRSLPEAARALLGLVDRDSYVIHHSMAFNGKLVWINFVSVFQGMTLWGPAPFETTLKWCHLVMFPKEHVFFQSSFSETCCLFQLKDVVRYNLWINFVICAYTFMSHSIHGDWYISLPVYHTENQRNPCR